MSTLMALATHAASAQPIDIGQASVRSQQGQRLKLAIPFGSQPGQRISVSRFWVARVSAPAGWTAPAADQFTVTKPPQRNLLFVQSRDAVYAPALTLDLAVDVGSPRIISIPLSIPPAASAPSEVDRPAGETGSASK
jgi:hypothetical protein